MKIAIIDDDPYAPDRLARVLREQFPEYEILSYSNVADFLKMPKDFKRNIKLVISELRLTFLEVKEDNSEELSLLKAHGFPFFNPSLDFENISRARFLPFIILQSHCEDLDIPLIVYAHDNHDQEIISDFPNLIFIAKEIEFENVITAIQTVIHT